MCLPATGSADKKIFLNRFIQTNVQAMCLPATERQKQQQKELSDVTGAKIYS